MSKYNTFADWFDDLYELFGCSASDINSNSEEYTMSLNGDLVAYWDRSGRFGYIDKQ